MILMWFLGVPSSDSRGFVLYKDDDKTDEVLSYIIDADGKIVCTVRGIPGLAATSTGQLGQNGKFYPLRSTQKKQASGSILAEALYPYHSEPMSNLRSLLVTI